MGKGVGVTVLVVFGLLQGSGSVAGSGPFDHRIARARNAALGFDDGVEFAMNPPSAEDRATLFALRAELDRWGRFWIVPRERAEILISIRDRRAGGGHRSRDAPREQEDVLSIYDARPGLLGLTLWKGARVDGLSGDPPPLLRDLRAHIEKLDQQP